MVEFWVGVDGGGTATRALLANRGGSPIGHGRGGPSALRHGAAPAWHAIETAIAEAFRNAGLAHPADWSRCALGAGLAGATHAPWREALIASDPGFGRLVVENDGYATLLGAHGGRPGMTIAAGTGSVADVLRRDGSRASIGGWGFPIGDEAGGAWLGLHAMRTAHAALDGRAAAGALAQAVRRRCGDDRDALLAWCGAAGQFDYATLAPLVFDTEDEDPVAVRLLQGAVDELDALARALDPGGELPVVISGSIGRRLTPRLPAALRIRCFEPEGDADAGALRMVRDAVGRAAATS